MPKKEKKTEMQKIKKQYLKVNMYTVSIQYIYKKK